MKTRILATLLIAASASIAAPAFASSGYGPAPFYHPLNGAPASQRGQSTQTVAAEQRDAASADASYGGVAAGSSQAGGREAVQVQSAHSVYANH